MFTTNASTAQTNNDKIFTIEESQKAKRKSISFCMNEENMKDMTFYQNYFNNDVSFQKSGEHSKGRMTRIRGAALRDGARPVAEPEQWPDEQLFVQPAVREPG